MYFSVLELKNVLSPQILHDEAGCWGSRTGSVDWRQEADLWGKNQQSLNGILPTRWVSQVTYFLLVLPSKSPLGKPLILCLAFPSVSERLQDELKGTETVKMLTNLIAHEYFIVHVSFRYLSMISLRFGISLVFRRSVLPPHQLPDSLAKKGSSDEEHLPEMRQVLMENLRRVSTGAYQYMASKNYNEAP